MNIVEQLMQVDDNVINEKHIEVFMSNRLARLVGAPEPVSVEIKELPYRRVSEVFSFMTNGKGEVDFTKKVDAELMLVLEAVVNIDFKDHALMDKFRCQTPKDLAEKLFESEIPLIVDIVTDMAGYGKDDNKETVEEIKNS